MNLELHLIREDKLKVLLTPFDMMKYELTCEKLDYDNTETRKAIWNILDFAKHETGFDAAIGKIRIEVYPEKSGGCSIYITKINTSELPSATSMHETTEKQSSPKEILTVYKFQDADALMRVCDALSHRGYRGEKHAFFEILPDGTFRYFLKITETRPASPKKVHYLRENLFISEFADRIDAEEAPAYLSEHCLPLKT